MSGDWMRCSVTGLLFRLIISFHVFSAPQPPPPHMQALNSLTQFKQFYVSILVLSPVISTSIWD